jgi:hypothetical protein
MPILVLYLDEREHWAAYAAAFLEQHMQWAHTRLLVACGMPDGDPAQDAVLAVCKRAADFAAIGQNTATHYGEQWARHFVLNLARRAPLLSLAAGSLQGATVFVCGAGPSLEHALPHVEDLRQRGLIFAASNAAPALLRAGVMPDAVFCCEAQDVSGGLQAVSESPLRSDGPSLHVLDVLASPANWAVPADRHMAIASHEPNLARYIRMLGGIPMAYSGSVSCAATASAITLGATTVVLLGQDLGYPRDRMYSKGTLYEDLAITRDGDRLSFAGDSKAKASVTRQPTRIHRYWTHETPPTIDTDPAFESFRSWFAKACERRTIINASEGGSHIPGTVALGLGEVLRSLEPLTRRVGMPTIHSVDNAGATRATRVLDDIEEQARTHLSSSAIMPSASFPLLNMWIIGKVLAAASPSYSPRQRVEMYREAVRQGCEQAIECVREAREEMGNG